MSVLRRSSVVALLLLLAVAAVLNAHDLFFRPLSFFANPGDIIHVAVLNGTFVSSEAALTFDRLRDLRMVGPAGTVRPPASARQVTAKSAMLVVAPPVPRTYALGATVAPCDLRLAAKAFNEYLKEDGNDDVLEARRRSGELAKAARDRYSKSVKALLQVGDLHSGAFETVFGHPAELVALENPYTLHAGTMLRVRALVGGAPAGNQIVLSGGISAAGDSIPQSSTRTNADGVASIRLTMVGHWYVKFVHMVKPAHDSRIDYRSEWATLTFGLR